MSDAVASPCKRVLAAVLPLLLAMSVFAAPSPAAVVTAVDEQTGLRSWEWREFGVSLRLVQRLPDQSRAFFQARGFSSAEADRIAASCVFQTIFRNDGKHALDYALDQWRVSHAGKQRALVTREHWQEIWQREKASEAARIALHWALLPTRQQFEPGDYNWGMTSFGLPPGSNFDLEIVLSLNGEKIARSVSGIECAPDRTGN